MLTLRFDADQAYQREAIDAVLDLFAGQEAAPGCLPVGLGEQPGTPGEPVFANTLVLDPVAVRENLRRVQDRPNAAGSVPAIPAALSREFTDGPHDLDFSVEMETGTGKTYVFLRTIAELHRRYGFAKFVIVVPGVAVREGVLSALRQLTGHLRELYDGLQLDYAVWDPAKPARVRQFARAANLQLLVVSIDSFTTDTNIFNRVDPDQLNGHAPIEFLRACRPIVVLDEPQNLETPTRQAAIAALQPLFRLRYSATHRDPRHLVHRLTPVQAYDLGLVKRIGVVSVTSHTSPAPIEVLRIRATPRAITASARIGRGEDGRLGQVTLRAGDDLYTLSGGRSGYRGWAVSDIRAGTAGGPGTVEFGNGRRIEETGSGSPTQQREMIRQAVRSHFETELLLDRQLRAGVLPAPLKPLTLFFIDRVAHYHPPDSTFRRWFTEAYAEFRAAPRFCGLELPDTERVHAGYFATTATGTPKDLRTGRETRDAESAFARIMGNKERLLGHGEPLRFIFSHSALAEGWDNPNIFTICNLQDGRSVLRKRQQIGRGLRLPVLADGTRCRLPEINLLTVIAHESFATFAADLQQEIEEETGAAFTGRITDLTRGPRRAATASESLDPAVAAAWRAMTDAIDYDLRFDTAAIIDRVVARLRAAGPPAPARLRITMGELRLGPDGVGSAPGAGGSADQEVPETGLPETELTALADPVGALCRRVPLTRATSVQILRTVGLDAAAINPPAFSDQVVGAITAALAELLSGGVSYCPVGRRWTAHLTSPETLYAPETTDGPGWRAVSLPRGFTVPTPLGPYRPTKAYLVQGADGTHLHLTGGSPVDRISGMSILEKAQALQQLHRSDTILRVVNVWDPISTRAIAALPQTKAIATAGHSIAASHGYADGTLPLDLLLAAVERIVAATDLPVTADLDAGFGNPGETVRRAIDVGVVGANVEDRLAPLDDSVAAVRAVVAAAEAAGIPFQLNARTDAIAKAGERPLAESIQDAITRGRAYLEEGAALVFVPGILNRETTEQLVEGLGRNKLSVIGLPGSLTAAEYEDLGVARISYGPMTQRVALRALQDLASDLYDTGVVPTDTPALN